MDGLIAITLALLQGITEFLPISSSAHLILPAYLFGWPDQGLAFDVALHMGTLSAVVWYFREDLLRLTSAWLSSWVPGQCLPSDDRPAARMAWSLLVASVPAGLLGFFAGDLIALYLRRPEVIAMTTLGFAVLLGWADLRCRQIRELEDVGFREALLIGLAQAMALVPGTSRSGITLTAGLMLGLTREAAARYSFLLSIPVIAAAGMLQVVNLSLSESTVEWGMLGLGAGAAFISAYLCIRCFLKLIEKMGLWPFVLYRLALGGVLMYLFVI
ncbi:undecaprenyl-diphosphate phosphatase [Aliamphritea ceti]|uniref:undecaprenyl-diphosphate phosphatase n=1 Tax=Aliamphritea ceti TaxID=1524258 RepID=UPI0021C466E3|nr:undecaprenyl-diphosphate phosphatase [Aliamphritea ceti]